MKINSRACEVIDSCFIDGYEWTQKQKITKFYKTTKRQNKIVQIKASRTKKDNKINNTVIR